MKLTRLLLALPLAFAAGPALAQQAGGAIIDAQGGQIGTVTIRTTASGMLHLEAEAAGIPAGPHGFHLHETGECDAADGFKSAGGHLAGDHEHGVAAQGGPHPGDFPNVHVSEDGALRIEYFTDRVSLAEQILDADGSALVIHAEADDYSGQPSGNAGDRIACAVIEAQ